MEDSIQFLSLSSPEVIVIGDDTYDYEDHDGDIEVLEINKVKIIEESSLKKLKLEPSTLASASTSSASCSEATVSPSAPVIRQPNRSTLTGRRVFSPTDELLLNRDSNSKDLNNPSQEQNEDETLPLVVPTETETEPIQFIEEQPAPKPSTTSTSTSPSLSFVSSSKLPVNPEPEDDSDLSVIEIIQHSPSSSKKAFPGRKRFAPNPVFKPRTRSTSRAGSNTTTPVGAKKARLSTPSSSANKLSKSGRKRGKRQNLRERLEQLRLQQQRQSSGTPKGMHKHSRKESLIQQSLRNLSNKDNSANSAVSTSSGSRTSSPRKKGRKSLKRLRNNEAFMSMGTVSSRGGGSGRGRGRGVRSPGKSNQENIVSSTNIGHEPEAPSATLQTSWDYRSSEYERLRGQQHRRPDSPSSRSGPVPRNLDMLPPLPFSDPQSSGATKYDDSWKTGNGRILRGRGRGRGRYQARGGGGGGGDTGFGFDAGVPRNFELAPARFSPPQPITYSVDSGGSSSSYNPMAMLPQHSKAKSVPAITDGAGPSSGHSGGPPKLVISAYGGNLFAPSRSAQTRGTLRPIVIDGSNVAIGHGNRKFFSCRGIRVCVDYFKARGHQTILVFVPHFRTSGHQVVDGEVLDELEAEGILKETPGRMVDKVKISAYDDRFIVQVAAQLGGVVVSNDNFRDLFAEEPTWRETIHETVLQYLWISPDMIMFPDDPVGRGGPRLNDILRF